VTILAGILSRQQDVPLCDSLCDKMKRAISRNSNDDVIVFRDPRAGLFKVDVGAYREPAFRVDDSGSVSMLAGEPLLDSKEDVVTRGRSRDLELLHDAFDGERWDLFSQTQGVYCAVHYSPTSKTVTLVADKLGLRPIYYWIGPEYVIFSSALRVLESLAEVPKSMDLVAVTEITSIGFPVGNRTPYVEIKGLKGGEILQVSQDRTDSMRYWRWDSIRPSVSPKKVQLEEAYDRFTSAVRRRRGKDTAVVASLSGGLDSRCVVAALRKERVQVYSFNLYRVLQSQDQVFGADFARRVGTIHQAVALPAWELPGSFEQRITDAWRATRPSSDSTPERPQVLWMGDGGSVGVGHCFVQKDIIEALRAGQVNQAVRAYRPRLISKVVRDLFSGTLAKRVTEDIRAELEDLRYDDPGRAFHVFLMLYEQRYDLFQHFEDLDLHRLECHWPFFDGNFLASIFSLPVDLCLGHEFYTDWLSLFPSAVTEVPWQAYPGHRQCPLPIPEELAYQWDRMRPASEVKAKRHEMLQVVDRILGADRFPDLILNKRLLQLVRWLYKAGLRDGESTIKAADTYHRYWRECGGQFVANSL